MATWEELEAKYGSGAASNQPSQADPWAALEAKYSAVQKAEPPKVEAPKAPAKKELGLLDRVKAGMAGINKGFYSDLLGLPVDTVANVVDLAKAGAGYTTSKITGNAPPEWLQLTDRSKVVGSSDWLAKKYNDVGLGAAVNNPNPEDAASRIAYSGGRVGGASVVPVRGAPISLKQNAINVGKGVVSGTAGGAVGEVAPEWAGVAAMTPSLVTASSAAGIKRYVRGGEQGRREMEQRVQDFKNAGVDNPSVGLASGNRGIQGTENILSQTPGSVGIFERNKQAMLDGLQNKKNQLRDSVSTVYGPVETGNAIQSDLKGAFKNRINTTQGLLSDRVENAVGPGQFAAVDNTLNTATRLSSPIPGAEATSSILINPRIANIAQNLKTDVNGPVRLAKTNDASVNPTLNLGVEPVKVEPLANSSLWNAAIPDAPQVVTNPSLWNTPAIGGIPAGPRFVPNPVMDKGIPNASLWNTQKEKGIPFGALKSLRTDIGKEASSNAIVGTPEQAQFKKLYGAMTEDMRQAVNAADRSNSGVAVGPLQPSQTPGANSLKRSNTYYSRAMSKVDDLNQLANRDTAEGAYNSVSNSLKSGPTVYQRLRNAVTPETRKKVVATVIDEMGMAMPGQQGVEGNTWSPKTFLTNYNQLDHKAQSELFKRIPAGEKTAQGLRDIAKAADMISQGSKVWANPSGTAPALAARGTMYALTVGAYFEPVLAAGTASSLLAAHGASRLLLNPKFVNWLSKVPEVKPQDMQAYQQRLIANARMTNDKQFQQDVQDYLGSINQSVEDDSQAQ